jgi:hypothetical protein
MMGGAVDPVTLTMYDSRQTLGQGNLALYDELYPALRLYQQNKGTMNEKQILECMKHKPGAPLDPSITDGLKQIMDGDPNGGALTRLKHEQYDTLQKTAYDSSWLFRRSLDVSRVTGYPPVTFVVSADCTSSDKSKVVNFSDYPGALYDADKRWPFAQDCAKRFINLSGDQATSGPTNQALE